MPDRTFLEWPFFEPRHRALAEAAEDWAATHAERLTDHHDTDGSVARLALSMGQAGLLHHACPPDGAALDVRSLCILRETLARFTGLADFAFAMQGLGTGPITLFGTPEQKARFLPPVRTGEHLAAFALSEKEAGSDVAALATTAALDGDGYVLNGEKTWISNGAIAAHYVVFARTEDAPGTKALSALLVAADTPGLTFPERIHVTAPHPLATLRFTDCRIPAANRLGPPGAGFRIAMSTLDVFRSTVGAAALGLARRALDESLARTRTRHLFGQPMSAMPVVEAALAEMALEIDAAALLVYRAAWTKDSGAPRVTREAAMAKLYSTEAAQRVVDQAGQLFGGLGVTVGQKVEELYREVRALRIYEGASEVQRMVIGRQLLATPTN